ncbi:Probable starch synthase 4, chloroplastic/amyloplastic [Linum grandiflorum]
MSFDRNLQLDMLLKGLGFTQKKADSHRGGNSIWPWLLSMGAFSSALERAFRRYRNDMDGWQELVRRIMKLDFSWGTSAAHYEELYSKSVARARAASS